MKLFAWVENPRIMKRIMGWGVVLSVVLWVVAHPLGWIHSIDFVNELSLGAIFLSCGAWYAAESVRCRQAEEDIPKEVLKKLLEKTNLEKE